MKTIDLDSTYSQIKEGDEYQIVRSPDKCILYTGIAESDTEAKEMLERYAMYIRAGINVSYSVTLKLEKL